MRLLTAVSAAVLAVGCGVSAPSAPTSASTPAQPLEVSALEALYEPVGVYAGGGTQVKVWTFTRLPDGTTRGVYDVVCTFSTDGGVLTPGDSGTDTSWHVAVVSVSKAMADQDVHVQATCGTLSTTVQFHVWPINPQRPPAPPPPGTGGGTGSGTGTR